MSMMFEYISLHPLPHLFKMYHYAQKGSSSYVHAVSAVREFKRSYIKNEIPSLPNYELS